MLGLVVAFAGVALSDATGAYYLDGVASVLIGLILGATAIWLAYETKGLLIGEAANRPVVMGIRKIVEAEPSVDQVNEVLTMHMGPEFILANLSVDFADDIPAAEMERVIADMDARIKAAHPEVKRVFIEAEARRGVARPGPGEAAE